MPPLPHWMTRVRALFGGVGHRQEIDWPAWETRIRRIVASEVDRVLPYFPDDGLIVDVGANIGLFTAVLLERRPRARAICFEPVASFCERCRARFASNPNVRVLNLALGNKNERATIYKPDHNPGGNSLVKVQVKRYTSMRLESKQRVTWEREDVEVRVFDDWAREARIERVDLIKTDTEGHDYAVLQGVLPFLERTGNRPVILSELLSKSLHHAWSEQSAVVQRLYEFGYQKVDLEHMREIEDILFVPGGRERAG
ncbi:MAG: FkbM family methyltransferase [Planctomycetes bacterium]|nr:FkbM family methyltransferase [Planctomycetota bacterium]